MKDNKLDVKQYEKSRTNSNIPGMLPDTSQALIQTLKTFRRYIKKNSSYSLVTFIESFPKTTMDGLGSNSKDSYDDEEIICAAGNLKRLLRVFKKEFTSSTFSEKKNPSVVMDFLSNTIYDQKGPINVRRTALMILGELLKRSKDCRHYFFTSTSHMKSIVSSIMTSKKEQLSSALSFFQKEAIYFFRQWTESFSNMYPLLWVATRYLEERRGTFDCTNMDSSSFHTNARMERLRNGRDLALTYGQSTAQRVRAILEQMNCYFDILVPRFGFDNPDSVPTMEKEFPSEQNMSENEEVDDGEDDGVDWEDGDVEVTKDQNYSRDQTTREQHLIDVEQTIQIMTKTGSVFEGELQINLTSNTNNEHAFVDQNEIKSDREEYTLQMLELFMDILNCKYIPQLSFWIESLISADAMTHQHESSSFTLLPESMRQKRAPTLKALLTLRENVTKMLSLANTTILRYKQKIPFVDTSSMKQQIEEFSSASSSTYGTNMTNQVKQLHTKRKLKNFHNVTHSKKSRHKIKVYLK